MFFTASAAFVSISGTCLCAAACATTCGRCSRNTASIRSRSPTSPTTGTIESEGHASHSSRSTVYSAGSDRSTSSSRDGEKRATCRASSAPIDPPAPVTITTLPPRNPTRSCSSSDTVSRCSRSSTRTSRSCVIDTRPCSRSYIAGIICARTGIPSQIERIRRRLACGASAIVMITWSIPSAGTSVGSASVDPSTFSPLITAPCFSGSSSTNPRRSMSCSPRLRISRTAITPAAR